MPSLVLASSSPRRAALLSESGFEFDVAPPRVAEKFDAALTLRELTLWNAIRKGMSMAQTRPDAVVLAADTLVALKDEIIDRLLTDWPTIVICCVVTEMGSFTISLRSSTSDLMHLRRRARLWHLGICPLPRIPKISLGMA